jgi:cyclin B
MLIASKYEEMYAPEVRDFVYITANTYSSLDIQNMESEMLRALDYSFGNPLCLHFLRRNSRAGDVTPEIHMMAKFLLELCLTEYSILKYVPSQLSAAALYISKKLYNDTQWTPVLRYYSTYAESDLLPCVKEIAHVALNASISKQQAVVNKYNGVKYLRISKEPRLTGKIMKELANN